MNQARKCSREIAPAMELGASSIELRAKKCYLHCSKTNNQQLQSFNMKRAHAHAFTARAPTCTTHVQHMHTQNRTFITPAKTTFPNESPHPYHNAITAGNSSTPATLMWIIGKVALHWHGKRFVFCICACACGHMHACACMHALCMKQARDETMGM